MLRPRPFRPAWIGAVVVAVLSAAACGDDGRAGTAAPSVPTVDAVVAATTAAPVPDPVYVGAVLDLSGPDAALGAEAEAALEAQVAALDDDALLGRPVRLVVRDGAGDLERTVAATEEVLAAGAVLVVLGCRGDLAAAGASVAEDRDAVAVSACAPTADVGTAVGPATFSLGVPADAEGFALASVAAGLAARTAVAVTELSLPGSIARCEAFTERFAARDGQVQLTVDLSDGTGPSPADVATAVTANGPALVVSCAGGTSTEAVVDALRSAGWNGPVLAGTAADHLLRADPATVGLVGVLGLVPGPDRADRFAAARDELADAAGVPLGDAALAVAAAVELFVAAAGRAGTTEASALAGAVHAAPVDTLLGTVAFDRTNRLARPVTLHLRVLGADGVTTQDVP